jgi:hypothetical protein
MTPLMRNLTLLLAVQLLLALWLFSSNDNAVVSQPLLPQLANADTLVLSSKDSDTELKLTRQDDVWRLAGTGLSASQSKIDNLLRDLSALKTGWPVAQSSEAQSRFGVSESKYEQKLVIKQADTTLHTLYLGDSPAFRQLYLRKDGDDAIYKGALNRFELSVDETAWLDKQLLRLPMVDSISQGDNQLQRQGSDWQLRLNGETQPADSDAARDVVAKLTSLSVLKRAEKAPLSTDINELQVRSGARDYTYQLVKQADNALIRRTDIDYWFEISQYSFDQLYTLDWTALVKADTATDVAASDSDTAQNPPASGE